MPWSHSSFINNWILMSCQPYWFTSGCFNMGGKQIWGREEQEKIKFFITWKSPKHCMDKTTPGRSLHLLSLDLSCDYVPLKKVGQLFLHSYSNLKRHNLTGFSPFSLPFANLLYMICCLLLCKRTLHLPTRTSQMTTFNWTCTKLMKDCLRSNTILFTIKTIFHGTCQTKNLFLNSLQEIHEIQWHNGSSTSNK